MADWIKFYDTGSAAGTDSTQTVALTDANGNPAGTRPYTAEEVADANARATAATRHANLQTIFNAMQNARSTNTTFLGLSSPTNADIVSEVRALARQNNGIMRVLYGLLKGDPTALDGTN